MNIRNAFDYNISNIHLKRKTSKKRNPKNIIRISDSAYFCNGKIDFPFGVLKNPTETYRGFFK